MVAVVEILRAAAVAAADAVDDAAAVAVDNAAVVAAADGMVDGMVHRSPASGSMAPDVESVAFGVGTAVGTGRSIAGRVVIPRLSRAGLHRGMECTA